MKLLNSCIILYIFLIFVGLLYYLICKWFFYYKVFFCVIYLLSYIFDRLILNWLVLEFYFEKLFIVCIDYYFGILMFFGVKFKVFDNFG